jgi:hypothetical protein
VENVAHVEWVPAAPDPEPEELPKHLIRFRFKA